MNIKEPKIEIVTESGCWIWLLHTDKEGYGTIWKDGKNYFAHRHYYEMHKGLIPAGLQIDHTCNVRCCVNPYHLDPVTGLENMRRMAMRRSKHGLDEVCKHGHAFDADNTRIRKDGRRQCKTCQRAYKKASQNSQRVG
jgi:hypothetical protein